MLGFTESDLTALTVVSCNPVGLDNNYQAHFDAVVTEASNIGFSLRTKYGDLQYYYDSSGKPVLDSRFDWSRELFIVR